MRKQLKGLKSFWYYLTKSVPMESMPFLVTKIGRWWGSNAHKRRQEEIDILAFEERKAIFGECKWTNEPVDIDAKWFYY